MWWRCVFEDELRHHGIKGQKWGVRNGPPYPLDRKRAKWVDKFDISEYNRNSKLAVENVLNKYGKSSLDKLGSIARYGQDWTHDNLLLNGSGFKRIVGEHSRQDDLDIINSHNKGRAGSESNCLGCAIAYEMRRKGFDVVASLGIDKKSGLVWNSRSMTELSKIFSGCSIKRTALKKSWTDLDSVLSQEGDNARGILRLQWIDGGGHFVNWETKNGHVLLSDGQSGIAYMTSDEYSPLMFADPKRIIYTRLDNLGISENTIDQFVEENLR